MQSIFGELGNEIVAGIILGAVTLINHLFKNFRMQHLSKKIDQNLNFSMEKAIINIHTFSNALKNQKDLLDRYIDSNKISINNGNLMLKKLEFYGHEFRFRMLTETFDEKSPFYKKVNLIIKDHKIDKLELRELVNEIEMNDTISEEEKERLSNIVIQLIENIPISYPPYTCKSFNFILMLKNYSPVIVIALIVLLFFYNVFPRMTKNNFQSKYLIIKDFNGDVGKKTKDNLFELIYHYLNQFDDLYVIQERKINKNILNGQNRFYLKGTLDSATNIPNQPYNFALELLCIDSLNKNFSKVTTIYSRPIDNKNTFIRKDLNEIGEKLIEKISHNSSKIIEIKQSTDFLPNLWEAFSYYVAAKNLWNNESLKDAEDSLKTALSLNKNFIQASLLLAEIYIFDGEFDQASNILTHLDELPKKKFIERDRLYFQALKCYKENRNHLIPNLNALKESSSLNADIWYKIGEAYFRNMNFDLAIENLESVINIDSTYSKAYNYLGYSNLYKGNFEDADTSLKEFKELKLTPNSFDSYGDRFFYQCLFDSAIYYKQAAINEDLNHLQNLWIDNSLSLIYSITGDFNYANQRNESYLQKIEDHPEKNWRYYFTKSWILYKENDYENALIQIDTSTQKFLQNNLSYNDNPELQWLNATIAEKFKHSLTLKLPGQSSVRNPYADFLLIEDRISNNLKPYLEIKDNKKVIDNKYCKNVKFFLDLNLLLCLDSGNQVLAKSIADYLIKHHEKLNYHATIFNKDFFLLRCANVLEKLNCEQRLQKILSFIHQDYPGFEKFQP